MKKFKDEKTWKQLEKEIRESVSAGDEITIYRRVDKDGEYYVLTLLARVWGMPEYIYNHKEDYEDYDFIFDEDSCGDWTPDDFVEDIYNTIHYD